MRTIRFERGNTLDDLVRRAYRIEGAHVEELTRRAERALLEANPHLTDLRNLIAGTTILIPEVPGARTRARTDKPTASIADHVGEASIVLARMEEAAAAGSERSVEEANSTARLAGRGELRTLITREFPHLVEMLDEIAKNAKEDVQRIRAEHDQLSRSLRAAREDLEALTKKLG